MAKGNTSNFSKIPELQELFSQARTYIISDGKTKRIQLYKHIQARAIELEAETEFAIINTVIAKYYLDYGKYKMAARCIFENLPLLIRNKQVRQISNSYNWLGGIHFNCGDYSTSLDFLLKEIEHNIRSGIEEHSFNAYGMIGDILTDIEDYSTAAIFYSKSKELAIKYPDFFESTHSMPALNNGLILLKIRLKDYADAEQLCYETIALPASKSLERYLPSLYGSLAQIKLETEKYQGAKKYLDEAAGLVVESDFENRFRIAWLKFKLYNAKKEIQSAKLQIKECLKLIGKIPNFHREKMEMLNDAIVIFKKEKSPSFLKSILKEFDIVESDFRSLQLKMALRGKQLVEITNQYAESNKYSSNSIEVLVIPGGNVSLLKENIYACTTANHNNKLGKNVCEIYVKDMDVPYRARHSLKKVYEKLNEPDIFIWIHNNTFINKQHNPNYLQESKMYQKISLFGKKFEVSRRRKDDFLYELKSWNGQNKSVILSSPH